ncbi:putative peptidoglycan biosynthesis-related [Halobacteriovorax marinus SJ]|uniref:Peptidoglycan biosynthesis-related n=1 Tax=Halobacteriovorax marinus (strain ATCC BAA-682 / DSM 15412 / SJ) TaxID=862908 RepID=E1X653_HALMS|nr:D-alanyl-D-alanine carboxypeptidase [Halobacteriovorax marinus]CBW27397.1 putative peptidoglycan biosynthesis-related [Halobacteriovorax marinus SJ]
MIQFLKISIASIICSITIAKPIDFKLNKDELVSISFNPISKGSAFNLSETQAITPASTLKLLSMIYALNTLGESFTFKTKFFYSGEIKNNTLIGDLYIVGDGDPYFNHPSLINLAMALKKLRVEKVEGNLYYDNTLFAQADSISTMGLGDQTYNPSLGALNSEFNRLSLWTRASEVESIIPGLPVKITKAQQGFFPTQNFRSSESSNESWFLKKGAKLKIREDLPVRDAGMWSAHLLNFHLNTLGIKVKSIQSKKAPSKNLTLITSLESLPLWNLVSLTMEYSNNLMAEAITLRACAHRNVSPITIKNCANDYIKSLGLPKDLKIFNASGLSVDNEISAKILSELLKNHFLKAWKNHTFLSLLSYSGQSGWIRNRLASPDYNLRVYAKTGSLDFVNNIAGYIRTKSGLWYSFSVLHTQDKKRNAISQLNRKNYKVLKDQTDSWRRSSLDRVDQLLENFIDNN